MERGLQARAVEIEEEFNTYVHYLYTLYQHFDARSSKLESAQAEIERLRVSLSRYTSTNNPLPPPPQPLPLDRFPLPLLSRHFSIDSTSPPDHSYVSAVPAAVSRARSDSEQALRVLPLLDGTSNSHGYLANANSNGSAHTHAMYIPNSGDLTKANGKANRDPLTIARDAEPTRGRKVSDVHITPAQPASSTKSKHSTPSQDVINQYRTSPPVKPDRRAQQPEQITVKSRSLVPDPEPTKRVYPPRDLVPSYLRDTSDARTPRYGSFEIDSDEEDEGSRRLNLARAHVAGYGEGLNEAHSYANGRVYPPARGDHIYAISNDRYVVPTRDASTSIRDATSSNTRYAPPPRDLTAPVRDTAYSSTHNAPRNAGVTMSVQPSATYHDAATPRASHGRLDSSSSTSSWVSQPVPPLPPSTDRSASERMTQSSVLSASPTPYIVQNREPPADVRGSRSARTSMNSMNSSLEFNSSWGERSRHDSIGSLSSLGLPNTVSHGGVRGQGPVAMTSPMFPRELDSDSETDQPRPYPQTRLPIVETPTHQYHGSSHGSSHGPSHGSSQAPRRPRLQGYMSDDERIRYPRNTSSSFSQHQPSPVHDPYRSNPSEDLRVQLGRRQSLNQSASLDSGTPPPLLSSHRAHSLTPGDNALALTFQNSPPGSFYHGRRQSPEQIRAPAPRVGGPTVLTTMWR